jgi:glycosyltransferase involved in cell wall biosynthesis
VGLQDPWRYLEQIDVFVLPSLWEGMPFALLEAMGFGLPCVATDVGGVRDVIPDETFGIVVPPADPGALRDAILRYVDFPHLRETVGAAARRRIVTEFSRERMVERTLGVYSEVLGRQKNQRKRSR